LGTYDVVAENTGGITTELSECFTVESSTGMQLHSAIQSADSFRIGSRVPVKLSFVNTGNVDLPYLIVNIIVPAYVEPVSINNSEGLYSKSELFKGYSEEIDDFGYSVGNFGSSENIEFNMIELITKDVPPQQTLNSVLSLVGIQTPEFPLVITTKSYNVNDYIVSILERIEKIRQSVILDPSDYDENVVELALDKKEFYAAVLNYNYINTGLIEQEELDKVLSDYEFDADVPLEYSVSSIRMNEAPHTQTLVCLEKYWKCLFVYIARCVYTGNKAPKYCDLILEIGCNGILKRCLDVKKDVDPNEIIGPSGYGYENWASKDQILPYSIHFENDPEFATATARDITIRQTLDTDLNPRTFRLGSFGFGEHVFNVPENRASYTGRLDVVESLGVYVDVTAGIDVNTNEIFWTFRSIDPGTGLPPTNPLAGFLPVNDNETGSGQGFVSYTIRAGDAAVTGDVIDAEASIVFGVNEPVDTLSIFNTLDADYPDSEVSDNFEYIDNANVIVSWAGQDVEGGSGLSGFDIYVSDNGSAYEKWLSDTTETSAMFAGQPGSTYQFYSIAHDNAGNAETPPDGPDAAIIIILQDDDRDGVDDLIDNCPDIANPGQEDRDDDTIGDLCDEDIDGDTVPNETDNCPDLFNPGQRDIDRDGIGNVCDPCLAERLFDVSDPRLQTIRRFRDEMLFGNGLGMGIIDLYYTQSDDMLELIKDNSALRMFYKQLFETLIPVMEIMLDDPGN